MVRRGSFVIVSSWLVKRQFVLSNLQLWTLIIVPPSNQKCNTKRSRHDRFLPLGTLTEPQGQVAYRLCTTLNTKLLVVIESVVLRLDPGVLNHAAGIRLQTRHGTSNVSVDFHNLLYAR